MKNKLVSYYELLGMIKEGNIPEIVIYREKAYYWANERYGSATGMFLSDMDETEMFDKCIEIPNDDFEDIRELGIPEIDTIENERICRAEYKINSLIKNQKKIISILKEKK